MTYATIEDGESTPLQGGHSDEAISGHTRTNKRAVAAIVRAVMVGATIGALVLHMAGPLKMTRNTSSHVDGTVVVSSTTVNDPCLVAVGTFSGLSCKNSGGYCAGPGESFGEHSGTFFFETCYVSNNPPPNNRCWSRFHFAKNGSWDRCDPDGYFDGDDGYDIFGVWHVSAPLSDGSCGNPCREFK